MFAVREFKLLRILPVNGGRIVTAEALLQQVWGLRGSDDTDRVRTGAQRPRGRISDDAANPTHIFNEHGIGYRIAGWAQCRSPQKSRALQQGERAADRDEPARCAQHSHPERSTMPRDQPAL